MDGSKDQVRYIVHFHPTCHWAKSANFGPDLSNEVAFEWPCFPNGANYRNETYTEMPVIVRCSP